MAINFEKLHESIKLKTMKYKIKDIDIFHIPINEKLKYIENQFDPPINLSEIHYEHYQKHDVKWWNTFLEYWVKSYTNVLIIYSDFFIMPDIYDFPCNEKFICGILCFIRRPFLKEVYGRIICSKYRCGYKLLRYTINKYKDHSIYKWLTLHSEPTVIKYYERFEFHKTSWYQCKNSYHTTIYPYMIRSTCSNLPKPDVMIMEYHLYKIVLYIMLNLIFPPEYYRYITIPEIIKYIENNGELF